MSFILDVDTNNVPVFKSLPAGTEVQVRIMSCEQKNAQSTGNPMLAVRLDIPSEPLAKDIFHNIMLPITSDDEKKSAQKLGRLRDFKLTFGLPASGPIDSAEMEGSTGWAILAEEEDQNGELRNTIKRFVVGR
jgi:hypothetical protein